ncbi:MAG: hypothetical protein ABIO55_04260 [Ginsengibacter sp.]
MPDYVSQIHYVSAEIYNVVIAGGGIKGITTALLVKKLVKNGCFQKRKPLAVELLGEPQPTPIRGMVIQLTRRVQI